MHWKRGVNRALAALTGYHLVPANGRTIRPKREQTLPADMVECGVWRGGSMQAAARTPLACGDTSRDLYLFDTYEGMPPPSDADVRLADGSSAEQLLAESPRESKVWAVSTRDDVRESFA